MSFLLRLVLSAALLSTGLLFLIKTEPFVRMVGKNDWAERALGSGGTYSLWKLVGVLASFGAIVVLLWR